MVKFSYQHSGGMLCEAPQVFDPYVRFASAAAKLCAGGEHGHNRHRHAPDIRRYAQRYQNRQRAQCISADHLPRYYIFPHDLPRLTLPAPQEQLVSD